MRRGLRRLLLLREDVPGLQCGRVLHAPEGKACPIYECVVNHKGLKDCGRCGEVPCHIWKDTRDPKYTDEEFAENVRGRMEALKKKNLM